MFYEPENDGAESGEHGYGVGQYPKGFDGEGEGVIFQRENESINIFDEDAWDDSALLKAFNESLEQYPAERSGRNDTRRSLGQGHGKERSQKGGKGRSPRAPDSQTGQSDRLNKGGYGNQPSTLEEQSPYDPSARHSRYNSYGSSKSPPNYSEASPPFVHQHNNLQRRRHSPVSYDDRQHRFGIPVNMQQTQAPEQYAPPPLPRSFHGHAYQTARSWHGESQGRVGGVHLDKELADLLLSWYHSGYQAGRYQAMREMQENSYRYT
jgi:hypothetical protein